MSNSNNSDDSLQFYMSLDGPSEQPSTIVTPLPTNPNLRLSRRQEIENWIPFPSNLDDTIVGPSQEITPSSLIVTPCSNQHNPDDISEHFATDNTDDIPEHSQKNSDEYDSSESLQFHMSMDGPSEQPSTIVTPFPTNPNLPLSRRQEIDNWIRFPSNLDDTIVGPSQETTPTSPIAIRCPNQHNPDDISEHFATDNTDDIPEHSQKNPDEYDSSESLQFPMSMPESPQENSSTNIAETSRKTTENNPIDLVEISQQNPDKPNKESLPDDTSFSFQLKPASLLKRAVQVLSDSEFNEDGFGFIHVDENGFDITVTSMGNVTGVLSLSASGLINFQCRKPITESKKVSLTEMSEMLTNVDDDDTVTVYHVDGSKELSMFGHTPPSEGFFLDFKDSSDKIEKQPRIGYYCEAIVPSLDLRQMIEHLSQAKELPVVSVEIKDKKATIQVRDEETWKNDRDQFKASEIFGRRGENYRAWFYWSHVRALQKACQLHTGILVGFCSYPERNVGFQFSLGKVGALVLLKGIHDVYP